MKLPLNDTENFFLFGNANSVQYAKVRLSAKVPLDGRQHCAVINTVPILVAAWSKAWVCGRSLAGIAGSNTAGGMDVCLL
jgi:hypothetical protein